MIAMLAVSALFAFLYSADVTTSAAYIESGHYGSSLGSYAFNNIADAWVSAESGAAVDQTSWVGQDFGIHTKEIRRVSVLQHGAAYRDVSSYLLEYSDDNADWTTVGSAALADVYAYQYANFEAAGTHRYWRIRANSGTTSSQWLVAEVEMFEWLSDDTPTPSYVAIATLPTSGSQYAVMRSASFGEMAIVAAIAVVCIILLVHFVRTWIYARRVN